MDTSTAKLLISCPDGRGIIAAVAGFIGEHGGNIINADQHSDPEHAEFFMRVDIDLDGFGLDRSSFAPAWAKVADRYEMRWRIFWSTEIKRVAILVTKESHCLSDLLWRWKTGELKVEIPLVIGNHDALKEHTVGHDVAYHTVPITPETRGKQERRMLDLLREASVDLVVLARYMQVLSPEFVDSYRARIINIHHSFLPAFAGRQPYHQAYERGVKIIGATSHYVTDELDGGPIIAQATTHVDHRDTLDDLIRKGRDLERVVLATAVRLHVENKILVSQNKTVVFD